MGILKKVLIMILTLQSRLILRKYKPFIVAVTGSVGKTSTKDAIFCVLKSPMVCNDQHLCYVRKSEKSLNSEIGLPLSVIGVPNAWTSLSGWLHNIKIGFGLILRRHEYPDGLVLEVGADHPGDIRRIAHWLRPDIAVITRISQTPVHVEFFSSPQQVFEEKMFLAQYVKDKGTVVLYADEDNTFSVKESLVQSGKSVVTYGLSERADIRGTRPEMIYEEINNQKNPVGFSFTIEIKGQTESIPVVVKGGLGTSYMYTLVGAVAVAYSRGISKEMIMQALGEYRVTPGRMNVLPGINDSVLIDDTYNSSPDAVIAALDAVKNMETTGKKVVVLGDMMELGKYASEQHRHIGKEVAPVASWLVTVGQRSRLTADEAIKNGLSADKVTSFDRSEEAVNFLTSRIQPRDVVLIKGSQSMRMEKITKALLQHPETASELLVRQEKEWQEKD